MLSEHEEWIWLAGLLEGEGWFGIEVNRPGGRRDMIHVGLEMCDKDIVERAHRIAQGARPVIRRISNKPSRNGVGVYKDSYTFRIFGQKAEDVMRRVRPYMGERRGAKIDGLLAMKNLSHHPREKAAA